MPEVRWEHLKGRDAMRRLRRKPVGFLPIGCLERHGDHLPMGLDVLKAHKICRECARRIGGVVYPPHYYAGVHGLPEWREGAERRRFNARVKQHKTEWGNLYNQETSEGHLAEVIEGVALNGARVLVLYSGHYPQAQRDMVDRLARRFNRRKKTPFRVVGFHEPGLFGAGDHAGFWETSLYLAVAPDEVDMEKIGPRNYADHGWAGERDPRRASAAFGRKAVRRIVKHLKEHVAIALEETAAIAQGAEK